jgi:putative ABC transport system permease protein
MTTDVITPGTAKAATPVSLIMTLAVRELRSGIRGFYVFVACIALGVAVITGVGALADSLRASFESQGKTLLGGDVTLARPHQKASPAERAWLQSQGSLSESASMRAMARRADGAEQALVEIKGIDAAYPLVGTVKLSGGFPIAALQSSNGVAVEPIILERLKLKIGDPLKLGNLELPIRATIDAEPDKIADRLTVGPRVFVSISELERSGLIDPGSLSTWRYALVLPDRASGGDTGLTTVTAAAKIALPEAGFTIRDRRDPSPQITRTLERLRQFLTLIGLTSLIVGGVGVANAVATYIDRRRKTIASFKSLGATRNVIFGVHLTQVMLIAAIGIACGLLLGMLIPSALMAFAGDALPIKADLTFGWRSLGTAAGYGFLVTLLFTLWPLGRAEYVRPATLFRDEVGTERTLPPLYIIALTAAVAALLMALAVASSEAPRLAFYYCLGVIGVFAAFVLLGSAIGWIARRIPRPRNPELALALGNIGGPGGLAKSVVLSLGTGLSLLVAVALTDRSIVSELSGRVPETSPNYFVLDIKKAEAEAFVALVKRESPAAEVHTAPMLRGRLMKLGDRPVESIKAPPEAQWVLTGDRGLSYSDTVPEGSKVTDGTWWPAGYDGEPLVSFEGELAKKLGVKVGDTVTVNVLGRNVTARISNLRDVKWESLAINFVMVFSPNTLRAAPHNLLATITLPKDAPLAAEADIAQKLGREFPAATAIRVKDGINTFNAIFNRIMTAIRVAGSVTLIAGALVLAGAVATAQRRRIKQAVILKALGATRRRILLSHLAEYGILALVTAAIATLLGTIAAWVTVARVMKLDFVFSGWAVAQAVLIALTLIATFGGIGTWRVLQARPVPHLRSE